MYLIVTYDYSETEVCPCIPFVRDRLLALSAFLHSRVLQTGVGTCASEGFSAKQGHLCVREREREREREVW